MKFHEKVNMLSGIIKSIIIDCRLFGIKKGVRLPILFGMKTIVTIEKNSSIVIPIDAKMGTIKIGVNCGPFLKGKSENTVFKLTNNAKVSFEGKCNINEGSVINVNGGECIFGKEFAANANFLLSCEKKISFGDHVLFGWDCTVIDGDGHQIVEQISKKVVNQAKDICVGNHVWIAAKSTLLKGAQIAEDTVIGYGSIVTKKCKEAGCIIVGADSHAVKHDINWIR